MITIFDGVLIALMLISGILAMIRGFSREVLSVASWVVAALAAVYFYPMLSPTVAGYTVAISDNRVLADIASAAIIFIVVLIIVSLLTMRIADMIVDSKIGALDRTLGFVFGAARGALLVVIGLLFFNWLVPEGQPGWIADAKTKPMLESIGEGIVQMLPEDGGQRLIDQFKPEESVPEGEGDPA